jgi:predicted nuclease of predicted toxin-antitoxin system
MSAKAVLLSEGHEVEHVGEWPADPGDAAILAHAAERGTVVVTLDKDFGELAIVHGARHSGIVRLVDVRAAAQGPACVLVLRRYATELLEGSIITVEPTRTRVRLPDSKMRE